MPQAVTYESEGGVAVITINRPDKLNAFNPAVGTAMLAAWRRLNEGDDRVAIVTGAGERAFSAGADLTDPADMWTFMPGIGIDVDKPVIAAVNGLTVGIALVLVQLCDLAVMREDSWLSYPEAQLGFSGGLISGLAARIPHKIAMELMLVGDRMTARRAYEVGLVNRVVPAEQVMPAAREYAERLAANAPLVMAMLKRHAGSYLADGPSADAGRTRRDLEALRQSADQQEGFAAFREKRNPQFKGE